MRVGFSGITGGMRRKHIHRREGLRDRNIYIQDEKQQVVFNIPFVRLAYPSNMDQIEDDLKRSLGTISIDGYDRNVPLVVCRPVLASFSFVAEVVGSRRHKNSVSKSRFQPVEA